MKYADVILPLALAQTYTYGIPLELQGEVKVGCRVEVQFGARRIYSGVVKRVHDEKPAYPLKPVRGVLDEEPVVTPLQLEFWAWMAEYYCCTEGEIMAVALPANLKLVSETYVALNEGVEVDAAELDDDEFMVMQALELRREKQMKDAGKSSADDSA